MQNITQNFTAWILLCLIIMSTVSSFTPLGFRGKKQLNLFRKCNSKCVSPLECREQYESAAGVTSRTSISNMADVVNSAEFPAVKINKKKVWEAYTRISETVTAMFPIWTVLSAGLALAKPSMFTWFDTKYFTGALAALMLSMGVTITVEDISRVMQQPRVVAIGFFMCYILCPLMGFGLGKAFNLPLDLVAGMVLVGSLNGGQSSNLCTYIANGDVALSVLMTTVTTIAGIFTTPLLCKLLLGAHVPLDAGGIAMSCIQVILAPILLGMAANRYAPRTVEKLTPATPVVGVAATCLLVASAVSQCAPTLRAAGWPLQMAVFLLHLGSGMAGYWIARAGKCTETQCRTVAIETAMKSSAFGFLLAKLHFTQFAARLPPAVSVIWMTLTGATLSVIWRFIPVKDDSKRKE